MALRLDPKHFNTLINRGVAWEKMNKCLNALDDFTKAAEAGDTVAPGDAHRDPIV